MGFLKMSSEEEAVKQTMDHKDRVAHANLLKKTKQIDELLERVWVLEKRVAELELRNPSPEEEKAILQQELTRMGVKYDGRYSVEKLRELYNIAIEEAERVRKDEI